MDWTKVVYRIEGADDEHRGQGTGYACAREGGAVLVVTCWHVVREIGREHLRIGGLPCKLISADGDDDLDLAVLRVEGLVCEAPLSLAPRGESGWDFETFGYEPIGRPLSGTLGARTSRPHATHQDVPAWDYYLREGARDLEKIDDGYSGAPVMDAKSRAVAAVITHRQGTDKGFAIDVANLPRVYPPAAAWLAGPEVVEAEPEEPPDEYTAETNALAKILDHTDHLASLRDLLRDPETDRAIALVEACADDWPSYLADHIHLDPWPRRGQSLPEATLLNLTSFDERAFWQALIDCVAPDRRDRPEGLDADGERTAMRDWIRQSKLHVFFVHVVLERHGRHLPRIIRGAETALKDMGDFDPETRVLVLFACARAGDKPPFWWPYYARFRIARLGCCRTLDAMRLLDRGDIMDWYSNFPRALRGLYDLDPILGELLALFANHGPRIRYELARHCLVDKGALSRHRSDR